MPQDAFTLRHIARELNRDLSGGRINKINMPEREELTFLIYTGKRTLKLTVNVNASDCGVYFTQDEKENPLTAPNFCMLLRKHIQGAEIISVETLGFILSSPLHLRFFLLRTTFERRGHGKILKRNPDRKRNCTRRDQNHNA